MCGEVSVRVPAMHSCTCECVRAVVRTLRIQFPSIHKKTVRKIRRRRYSGRKADAENFTRMAAASLQMPTTNLPRRSVPAQHVTSPAPNERLSCTDRSGLWPLLGSGDLSRRRAHAQSQDSKHTATGRKSSGKHPPLKTSQRPLCRRGGASQPRGLTGVNTSEVQLHLNHLFDDCSLRVCSR